MYYEQKTSILDVPENSKESSVTLKGNNGGLDGLTADPITPISLMYLQCTSANLY